MVLRFRALDYECHPHEEQAVSWFWPPLPVLVRLSHVLTLLLTKATQNVGNVDITKCTPRFIWYNGSFHPYIQALTSLADVTKTSSSKADIE